MAAKKVGDLIKEARTQAGLTQEQLAKQVENVSASDISKAERGEKALTQAALKQIAKATGVTQKSLLEAPAGATAARKATTAAKSTEAKTTAAKSTEAKTTAAKKPAAKTAAAKETEAKATTAKKPAAKTTTTAKKPAAKTTTTTKKPAAKTTTTARKPATTGTSMRLTAAEKRIVELYRKADADTKKEVESLLKGEKEDGGLVGSLLGGAMGLLNNITK